MRPANVFEVVKSEYGEVIALLAVVINTIHLSTRPRKKDMLVTGNFWSRVCKKARDRLWEETQEDFDLAVKTAGALYEFETRRSLQGVGGCTAVTLREIVEREGEGSS